MIGVATFLSGFRRRTDGATSVEYALIGCLVSIAIIGGATALGNAVNARFQAVGAAVTAAPSP